MTVARAARVGEAGDPAWQLYERIGTFLYDQRLDPDPANFAFAWHLLHDSAGPLARAVAALTDGGVRLTRRDIESLGVDSPASARSVREKADGLVARTQMQVEGFQDMVQSMRDETVGFGRDLARSADTIRRFGESSAGAMLDELTRVTATMLERVHSAESRLENATREAVELRDKLEEARDNARRDPLTDLPNRRAFEEAYAELAATGASMCVALCDVDHFKGVNDRFGHAVGDRVLKTIAETLKASCASHLVARYGGEEFAILFAATGLDAARVTLDNARATVAAKRYRLRETDAPLGEITFSAGLTLVAEGESLGTSVGRADRLLYAAKSDGRNCVHAS
ncbi:MAG TPA: GGDEF domain-containing protein [Sphingomonas sp.]|nr:GGDEF domain-containing protein [Sphingomonas sp.]